MFRRESQGGTKVLTQCWHRRIGIGLISWKHMAKIDSNSGKNSVDALASLKDLYENREKDMETKHRAQVNELQKSHRAEIEKVREDANLKVKTQQEETSTKLNQRDLQYQKEVEAVRAMYQKRATETKKPS